MELTYTMQGDYQIPNLSALESPALGKYGMLRCSYLKKYREHLYTGLLLSDKLNRHLQEIDRQASEMMESLTAQMKETRNITEELKAADQMEWIRQMNSIRSTAEEIVMTELIYS